MARKIHRVKNLSRNDNFFATDAVIISPSCDIIWNSRNQENIWFAIYELLAFGFIRL